MGHGECSTCAGSSPLARGLRRHAPVCLASSRIIPARAGFTLILSWAGIGGKSSPLARGLHRGGRVEAEERQIIPARAGFTQDGLGGRLDAGNHPRSRGVYVLPARFGRLRRQIIPARAGFTGRRIRPRPSGANHPRSRGVYEEHKARKADNWKSSPLARGLREPADDCAHGAQIIPARAGFTLGTSWRPCQW